MPFKYISQDPATMNGQPCIKGTRLTVSRVLSAISVYPNRDELKQNYPELTDAMIKEVLAYSAAAVEDRVIDLVEQP
jgi:uncharacterized protein (DUF433 family)